MMARPDGAGICVIGQGKELVNYCALPELLAKQTQNAHL